MVMSIEPPFGSPTEIHPQSPHQPRHALRHAVVIGAGMGGLIAARVLAKHAISVTVLERDALPTGIGHRKGTPQGYHVHALLARGLRSLDAAIPGFVADLRAQGANVGDAGAGSIWFQSGARHCQAATNDTAIVATRPLFEAVLRQHVTNLPNVTIRDRTAVRGLCWSAARSTVTGVRLAERSDDAFTLCHEPADLVVDASGRGSQLAAWLADAGYPALPTTSIPVNVRYTTRMFARNADDHTPEVAILSVAGPEFPRGGIAFAVEGNRWQVTLTGRNDDNPPLDLEGFLAYAETLPLPEIARIVATGKPLDDGARFHIPSSTRHHLERFHRLPQGFLPFADSICAFTPVYGQGMTVAALEAEVLDQCLAHGSTDLLNRFVQGVTPIIDNAWKLACGGDLPLLMPADQLPRPVRLMSRYLHHLHQAARTDATVAAAFTQIVHLNAPVTSLVSPRLATRVLAARFRPRPARADIASPVGSMLQSGD